MNYTATKFSSPTERLLYITELLVEICEHVADEDEILQLESTQAPSNLARLARVCGALTKPALDVLWRNMRNWKQLVGLIRHFDGADVSEISENDWTILRRYTERVRSLRIEFPPSPAVKRLLSSAPPSRQLFTSLRSICIETGPPISKLLDVWEVLPLCSPHQIRDFSISVCARDNCPSDCSENLDRTCTTFIDFLKHSSTSLRTLRILPHGSWWNTANKTVTRTVHEIVMSCKGIKTLNTPINPEILAVVSGLALLKDVHAEIVGPHFPQFPSPPTFPPIFVDNIYIIAWRMGVKAAPQLNALLTAVNIFASKRWGINLFGTWFSTLQFIPELLDAIGITKDMSSPQWKGCTRTLVSFCLNGVELSQCLNVPLAFHFFAPLLGLPNLEELRIGSSRPVLVTDEDTHRIVKAWPRLKSLTLSSTFDHHVMLDYYLPELLSSSSPNPQTVVMTLEGLSVFARCMHLQTLEILVDVRSNLSLSDNFLQPTDAFIADGLGIAPPCPLLHLVVGNSRICEETKTSTVKLLSRCFPSIKSITQMPMTCGWHREDSAGHWRHLWLEVQHAVLQPRSDC